MWKQLTGEPVARKPHTGFGGRGRRSPFPTPIQSASFGPPNEAVHGLSNVSYAPDSGRSGRQFKGGVTHNVAKTPTIHCQTCAAGRDLLPLPLRCSTTLFAGAVSGAGEQCEHMLASVGATIVVAGLHLDNPQKFASSIVAGAGKTIRDGIKKAAPFV